MDLLLLKLAGICFVVFIVVPVFRVWMIQKIKASKNSKKGKMVKREVDVRQYQAIKEIWKQERECYYLEARRLFHDNMQQRRMNKEDIFELLHLIEDRLGDYVEDYKKMKFDNVAHKVYTLLKCYHLNEEDYSVVIDFLDELSKQEPLEPKNKVDKNSKVMEQN